MSLTTDRMAVALDEGLDDVTHVVWSENGSSQSDKVAPTAVTLKSATDANPSVKANDGALESDGATEGVTITHFAFANIDGETVTLRTTWNELDEPAVLLAEGKITVADGALAENLHQTSGPPA